MDNFRLKPTFHYSNIHSIIRNFSKTPGTLEVMVNKPPGKENRFTSASNALHSWLVRFYMKWLDACVQRFSLPCVAT
jgi:hypothetical protein